ncbi:molybdate ABC transporter substrate-binding protein [Caulobacter sp. ErkDOM-E]|uniref:molybdate ABC transporter substrate-binding protein n=1 Tax=Caulobacter sp. ErkDOM-E TaxID=3402778 RepID=UPI003AF51324
MLARRSLMVVLAAGLALLAGGAAMADETRVAVAANFTEPAKAIAARFEASTGHRAILSFGSSGQFYNQIANGAPFEVFLSADAERPTRAEAEGLAMAGTRFTYATGRLVLWSRTPGLVDAKGAVLAKGGFEKLAIADPKSAPYGQAAIETLTRLKLQDTLKPRIVTGSSITQTYQYVQTGAAELGFVALSQVVNEPGGSRWLVPPANHTPIDQQAVLLKTGSGNPAARAFLQFLKGSEAKAIIRRYGYEVP